MSAIANIVAFDGAATPVSHTLVPESVTRNGDEVTAVWREQIASLPIYAQPLHTMKRKRMGSGVYRVSSRTEVPVMESVGAQNSAGYTAPPKVAHVLTTEVVGYYHERSTIEERRLARGLSNNINRGNTATFATVITGPAAELFDQLVAPN